MLTSTSEIRRDGIVIQDILADLNVNVTIDDVIAVIQVLGGGVVVVTS